jgi:uncharacterized peroxidase-related enzyme
MAARRAFEWFQNVPSRGGRKLFVRPYDYGFVGEMSVLMKAHPLIGPALAELFMPVMFAPGALARPEREMIAAVAAAAQDCHYWTQSHAEFLRAEGEDSELIEAIQERRWRELRRLAARERALCAIAEKLSATAPRVTVEDWRAPHIATTTLIGLTK